MSSRLPRFGYLVALALSLAVSRPSRSAEPAPPGARQAPIPAESLQILLVRSTAWLATGALAQRYERQAGGNWHPVGETVPVNVGRHGMAWGRGLQPLEPGPQKNEGDGRTPAGIFRLGPLFGYAETAPESAAPGFEYIPIHAHTDCVEDPRSPFCNRIIDPGPTSPMLRADGLFRLGFVIAQNAPDAVPGAGSCVFFHVQRGPGEATSGCTSTSITELSGLVSWLKPESPRRKRSHAALQWVWHEACSRHAVPRCSIRAKVFLRESRRNRCWLATFEFTIVGIAL
ncbi:MAG TPA: hypothetical protein VIK01_24995 [Polyangiaceae bacterium]